MTSPALYLFPNTAPIEGPCRQHKPSFRSTDSGSAGQFPPRSSSLRGKDVIPLQGVALQVPATTSQPIVVKAAESHCKYSMVREQQNSGRGNENEVPTLSPVMHRSPVCADAPKPIVMPRSVTPPVWTPATRLPKNSGSLRRREANRHSSVYSQSIRSASPTLVRSNSGASNGPEVRAQHVPMTSMFPQYQPELPLSQQQYYPHQMTRSQLPPQQISKGSPAASSFAFPAPSPRGIEPSTPQRLPLTDDASLFHVWQAANGEKVDCARLATIRLGLKSSSVQSLPSQQSGVEVTLESASGTSFYMATVPAKTAESNASTTEVNVQRQHPSEGGTFPAAQMDLKSLAQGHLDSSDSTDMQTVTSIFPQVAALSAIKSVANSLQARSIAQFDPNASSPQAAQLAFDVVSEAKEAEEARLVSQGERSSDAQRTYELCHPRLGAFVVTAVGVINLCGKSGRVTSFNSVSTQGRITMHLPQPEQSSSQLTPVLASLDLQTGTVELDMAAMSQLDSSFMVDTVVSTLLAVAVSETWRSPAYMISTSFAAPPRTPTRESKKASKATITPLSRCSSTSSTRSKLSLRSLRTAASRRRSKAADDPAKEKMPALTRGVLHMLGFSFDAIVWLLSLGVKVLTKLVMIISTSVEKA